MRSITPYRVKKRCCPQSEFKTALTKSGLCLETVTEFT
jgi:hypothetical protein